MIEVLLFNIGLCKKSIIDFRTESGTYDSKEFQANMFASAFLMPENAAREVWNSVYDIDVFADVFDVSRTSAQIRLSVLGLI